MKRARRAYMIAAAPCVAYTITVSLGMLWCWVLPAMKMRADSKRPA